MLLLTEILNDLSRYFLEIAYRGTNYHGWQLQPGEKTIQHEIESALSMLLRKEIRCVGCGRTDTGVHAKQFFLHFDSENELDADKMVYRLNGMLDFDIAVNRMIAVNADTHARFDAVRRTYRYFIHLKKNPFLNDRSTYVVGNPDVQKMNEAASFLTELNDFKSFAKVHADVKHHRCELSSARWIKTETGDQLVFEITANRFLRNMVRAVVGTLLDVGLGKTSLEEFKSIATSGDRSKAGKSVDARGLFLWSIAYPYLS